MSLPRRKKVPTLAQIKRNPPPGAKGYRRPDEKGKRKPGQGRR
ncbi:hypothetical protein SAMN04487957_110119 [Halomonas shengliensis]|uniref:Uncharacterized protein n=1 Tax=Halomonas shengliensis TaxID=419597 RepID=A0A1H0LUZ4_9GAMM|nr:hypothetical protein [Halomonas shengliensis]SDO72069.1 hypothetical protein SAMN04487957_110119 [Halomonas shengliensis]